MPARSFNNPFENPNANEIKAEAILDFWCEPQRILSEPIADWFHEKCLFIEGGRGCGKTMLLRYISFEVQALAAKKSGARLLNHIQSKGGIGFYVQIDNAVLKSFQKKRENDETPWDQIFAHFFELVALQSYLQLIGYLEDNGEITDRASFTKLLHQISKEIRQKEDFTLTQLFDWTSDQVRYVERYRGRVAFEPISFAPPEIFGNGELIRRIPGLICKAFPELSKSRILLCVDEYENFTESQQRLINSLIRSADPYSGFRLGMRPHGLVHEKTVSDEEFIKEHSDYRKLQFKQFLDQAPDKRNEYDEYLKEMARKRLETVAFFAGRGLTDIEKILGHEDEEDEARRIANKKGPRKKHFETLRQLYRERADDIINELSYEKNPLFEVQNIVYLMRGRHTPQQIREAMEDYVRTGNSKPVGKGNEPGRPIPYGYDYIHKNKLSLLLLLAHHTNNSDKEYYGFRTFRFLSSGIQRSFINLCKTAFFKANYADPEIWDRGVIPSGLQDEAARYEAKVEIGNFRKVNEVGTELEHLALNLGQIFRTYHRDWQLRYPELNTFTLGRLAPDAQKLLKKSLTWSVIQIKPTPQTAGPKEPMTDHYTLNRLVGPLFNISYRTRGQGVEHFDSQEFVALCSGKPPKPHKDVENKLRAAQVLPKEQQTLKVG